MLDRIDEWLATEHCGVRGIWIAMFALGVILTLASAQ